MKVTKDEQITYLTSYGYGEGSDIGLWVIRFGCVKRYRIQNFIDTCGGVSDSTALNIDEI